MISEEEIKGILKDEGFTDKFLTYFQVDEGVEDSVTGKKGAWTVSWQLDTSRLREYVEIASTEKLREVLQTEYHQNALIQSRSAYLEKKCMKANQFDQQCVDALSESKSIIAAIKKVGKVDTYSVQPDFYEPSMFCIVEGGEKINDESEYDNRCVAGSMEEAAAKSVLKALQEAGVVVNHVKILAGGGRTLVNEHVSLIEKHDDLIDKNASLSKEVLANQNEVQSLKARLDEVFENALLGGGGEGGNVTVANPKQFAKIVRVLEGLHDKIELAQNGEEVKGLPISGPGAVSKELMYFKSMIEMILGSVKG